MLERIANLPPGIDGIRARGQVRREDYQEIVLPLLEAARNVVPVSVTSVESVDRLRTWASGRCLSADHPGIYQRPTPEKTSRRKVAPPASPN